MRALCISKLGDTPVLSCLEQPEPTLHETLWTSLLECEPRV